LTTQKRALHRAADMYPLIEAYLESGLSQKQFYQQHNLSLDVFQYWLRHYRKSTSGNGQNQPSDRRFLALQVTPPVSLQLNLPGGLRMQIEGLSKTQISALLNLFSGL
jgi:hypothetical protein